MTEIVQLPELIGIHVLSEFVFCPRAGLVTLHQQTEDTGVESRISNLNYMPLYELKAFIEEIEAIQKRLTIDGVVAILLCIALLVFSLFAKAIVIAALIVFGIVGLYFFAKAKWPQLRRLFFLYRSYKEFTDIKKRMPSLENQADEELDWRELIRFGFELTKLPQKLVDENLGVVGTPWKVLLRNDMCIPVFRCKPTKPKVEGKTQPTNWLYQQHYVRMAAYCAVVEKSTGYSSPFGLILFSGTYRVFAIKMGEATTESLEKSLKSARANLDSYRHGNHILPHQPTYAETAIWLTRANTFSIHR